MELILQIVRDPAPQVGKQHLRVFGERGGTIGRALDCFWVIPDPKSFVSSRHCVIECREGAFWLRDVSRNGVMLNGTKQRLEFGQRVRLREGDRIRVGLYELVAHIRDASEHGTVSRSRSGRRRGVSSMHGDSAAQAASRSADASADTEPAPVDGPQPCPVPDVPAAAPIEPAALADSGEPGGSRPAAVLPGDPADQAPDVRGTEEAGAAHAHSAATEGTGDHPVAIDVTEESVQTQVLEERFVAAAGIEGVAVRLPAARVATIDKERLRHSGLLPPANEQRLISNQFRHIKRGLLPRALGKRELQVENGRLIMVTSSLPGEGKTFCTMNLAMSLAREKDIDVVLVDADVAKPKLSTMLGIESERGLLHALADDSMDANSLVLHTDVEGLSVLSAGRSTHDDETELLGSERMREVAAEILGDSPNRVVIFDSPPLLLTNEARVLADVAGQVLLVVRAGVTPKPAVLEALEYLGEEKPVGLLLNQSKANRPGSYYGYGDYGYGHYGDGHQAEGSRD